MQSSDEKLSELILYITGRTVGDEASGAIKLNKYLWFAEVAALRKLGRTLTGSEYHKLKLGPAPRRLPPVRARLISDGAARLEQRSDAFGHVHHDLIPNRAARTELFTEDELSLVDEVVDALRHLSAAQVSELSHQEAGWQLVDEGEVIPPELAFVLAPAEAVPTAAIRAEGLRLLDLYRDRLT
ncbi:MAG: Panacea domain-containing protein [Acidimicrobiales bacterium]